MWVLNFVNLSCGAGMLLYDGSPFHPRPTILLDLAEQVGYGLFLLLRSIDLEIAQLLR